MADEYGVRRTEVEQVVRSLDLAQQLTNHDACETYGYDNCQGIAGDLSEYLR